MLYPAFSGSSCNATERFPERQRNNRALVAKKSSSASFGNCFATEAKRNNRTLAVKNLTLEVVLELIPLRLFGVNGSCLLPVCCALGGSAASPARRRRAYHAPQGSRARQRAQPTPRMAHPAHTARTHEVGLGLVTRRLCRMAHKKYGLSQKEKI